MAYVIARGPTGRMVAISYGKERPVCTEHTEERRAAAGTRS